ncbi:MAG: hypothetical protein M3463_22830, partial [Verrucomicrobiota bacterium]|nr:hypothetical protein [Verrucomicrobiota bacterium]
MKLPTRILIRALAPRTTLCLAALLIPSIGAAQQPPALPERVPPAPPNAAAPAAPNTRPAPVALPVPVAPANPADGIRLNFQGASLSDVLNYLSEAAGFVIVQEAPVTGTVNIVSRQSISADEAVDLLNAVLIEKGYLAIRNGRILKIVNRKDAHKRDLPV